MVLQIQNNIDLVIHHHPCPDGFGSAFAVWKYYQINHPERLHNIEFYGAQYGRALPNVEDKNVLICDFSYDAQTLETMILQANSLVVIDHHKSAMENLEKIDEKNKIFDMKKSGAVLVWEYFFPGKPIPLLLQYIQDRDIWTKNMPNTDAFFSWFYTLPFDFEIYDEYMDESKLLFNIETTGKQYMKHNEYLIVEACKHLTHTFCEIKGKYYMVVYTNSTVLKSDIGNRVFKLYPYADFSVVYSLGNYDDSTYFSLRSTNCHVDVSAVAKKLGGGGHRNASGASVNIPTNILPSRIISRDFYDLIQRIKFITLSDKYKVCVLNATSNQYELAKYMLQTKFINKLDEPVQEATFISHYKKIEDMDKFSEYINEEGNNFKVHATVVWWDNGDSKNDRIFVIDSSIKNSTDLQEMIEKIEF